VSVKLASALVPPALTTTQRDAIPAGRRPPGSLIFNTTTNRHETNLGTDAAPIWLPVGGGPLDIQSVFGDDSGYTSNFTGSGQIQLVRTGGGLPLRLTYTPPVNAWWEASLTLGLLQKASAEYTYLYGGCLLTPADADGRSSILNLVTQHSQVQTFEGRIASSMFKLSAGIAYQLDGILTGGSGGSWNYYIGKHQLELHAKAFVR
jgi:hypothetical protein